jgi:acyl-coenzyme A synthetase/AMP-(fatty) acid ligase
MSPPAADVARLLDAAAALHPDNDFLIGAERLSYRRVAELTRRAAAWLARAGLRRGDRVLVAAANRVEVILIALAVARVGAVFTLLHEEIKRSNLRRILTQVEPFMCAFDESTAAHAGLFQASCTIWLGRGAAPGGGVSVEDLLEAPEAPLLPAVRTASDPVCLIFTSGSTGEPRGVVVSHDNVVFTTAAIQERLRYEAGDVIGLFVPLAFDYGLYQVFLAANVGAALYVGRPDSTGPAFLPLVAKQAISVLPMVPGMIGSLLKLLDRGPTTLPHLRCVTSTGDHLPQRYVDDLRWRLPGIRVYPMYGLTECKRVSILVPEEWSTKSGTVGRPLAGTTARVVGPDGRPLPPGSAGELVVSGRHVTLGYWRAAAETRRRFNAGGRRGERELLTGDICQIDEDGFLSVIGRTDSLIKHQGFRVSTAEVELEACRIVGVIEAALVQSAGGALHLFARAEGDALDGQHVRRRLRDHLERYKVPDHVHTMDDLPRTANGKIDRQRLKAAVDGGGL